MGGTCGMRGLQERCVQRFGWGKLNERENLEEQCVDVRIMLISILKKYDERVWIGLIWLRIRTGGGLL
jgi:hypothetical protein